jgi:hypothetical protein
MCQEQGTLNSESKKVSCSCHRPNSPTDCDIGSSSSSSSVFVWKDEGFGVESPDGGVASVIGTVRKK